MTTIIPAKKAKVIKDKVAEYVRSPRMIQRVWFDNALSCIIYGNYGTYQTRVVLDKKRIKECDCSCPSDYWPCKHVHALIITYQEDPNSFVDVEKTLASLKQKTKEELLTVIRRMAEVSPPCLQALGVKGFENEFEDEFDY